MAVGLPSLQVPRHHRAQEGGFGLVATSAAAHIPSQSAQSGSIFTHSE